MRWSSDETSENAAGLRQPSPASVTDGLEDLLDLLPAHRRRGLISQLTVGYYEGWRPSRSEVADLIAIDIGVITLDQWAVRQRQRRSGPKPPSIERRLREASASEM